MRLGKPLCRLIPMHDCLNDGDLKTLSISFGHAWAGPAIMHGATASNTLL